MVVLKVILVIFFLLMCLVSFAGSTSDIEKPSSKQIYAGVSIGMGLLAIIAAVFVK